MIDQFSIGPSGEYDEILSALKARAETDRLVLHFDRGKIGDLFVFCASELAARREQQQFLEGGALTPSVSALQVDRHSITVYQNSPGASRDLMEEFVRWLLRTFAPCRVFDDNTQEELTDQVAADPSMLFTP